MINQNKIFRLSRRFFEVFCNDRSGFTLSEVLIIMAIMGTLMAMTIPTLVQTTQKKAFSDGLQKVYGMLDTATNRIMSNNSGTLINAFASSSDARDKFGNILEYNKTCDTGAVKSTTTTTNCWASSTLKLSGGAAVESFDPNVNYTAAILADGTDLLFYIPNIACNGTGVSLNLPYSSSTQTYLCGYIVVDVNGLSGPNTFGRDMYVILLGSNGLYAGGDIHTIYNLVSNTVNCSTTDTTHNGYGCAGKVLNEGAMNY